MTLTRFLRFWLPLLLAVAFTGIAIYLAVGPNHGGPYDANLAILTATLIAIVWYTFLMYLSVTRDEPTYLTLALEFDRDWGALRPLITNPTSHRVTVQIELNVWVAKTWVDLGPFYRGQEDLQLERRDGIGGWLELKQQGNEILAEMTVKWRDDVGRTGVAGPRYWLVETEKGRISAVIASDNLKRQFGGLIRGKMDVPVAQQTAGASPVSVNKP